MWRNVTLSDCLSVCLSVCSHDNSRSVLRFSESHDMANITAAHWVRWFLRLTCALDVSVIWSSGIRTFLDFIKSKVTRTGFRQWQTLTSCSLYNPSHDDMHSHYLSVRLSRNRVLVRIVHWSIIQVHHNACTISPHALRRRRVGGLALIGCGTCLAMPLTCCRTGPLTRENPQLPPP